MPKKSEFFSDILFFDEEFNGIVPIEIIRFAQIANGIMLPVIGLLLLFMVNNSQLMRGAVPSKFQNTCFILIELFFIFLGTKSLGLIF